MGQRIVRSLDRTGRIIQNLLGPRFTQYTQNCLGGSGTRFIRETLGRSPRHRVQIDCNKLRIGRGINSWVICPDFLTPKSIVYSLGVGKDITFDLDLISRFGTCVFAFDPTPTSVTWVKSQQIPKEFHFIESGISNFDGFAKFYALGNQCTTVNTMNSDNFVELQVYRLITMMNRLGHDKIDLLKMDIEGEEYTVIADIISSGIWRGCRQLAVEFHHRFHGLDASKTESAVTILNQHGYRIFDISDSGNEYSFIKV